MSTAGPADRRGSDGGRAVRVVLAEDHRVVPALRTEAPATQIVVLTMQDDPSLVRAARQAGALGYVLKESADTDLVDAVRRAAAGEPYLNRSLAARLIAARAADAWD